MIRSVGADRESFKTLTFGPGLNVILADKSRGASDRQSRNGAGKTSFVELVHFCSARMPDRPESFDRMRCGTGCSPRPSRRGEELLHLSKQSEAEPYRRCRRPCSMAG